jgi:hypothetical protein
VILVLDFRRKVASALVVCIVEFTVIVLQSTSSCPATTIELPELEVKVPEPAHVKERLLLSVVLSTAELTLIAPELSTKTLPTARADCKSISRILVTVAPVAWKTPSTNCPFVVALAETVTAEETNVGVIEKLVPTNASAVTVSVRDPLPTFDVKPSSAKVATPPWVRTVTEVTAEPEFPTLST